MLLQKLVSKPALRYVATHTIVMPMSQLRSIDRRRLDQMEEVRSSLPNGDDIWFIHTVLAQCFLPYRNPRSRDWHRKSGDFSIFLTAGTVEDPTTREARIIGLPFGAKPRLFQSYVCTQVIKQQSPVIPVEPSMSAMMEALGLRVTGGKQGTINRFKEQITRFAACNFTLVGPGPKGTRRHMKAPPVKRFDAWFPSDPGQEMLWPSEIVLTDDYYLSLKDHAVPYDFRGMRAIQSKPRAQDIYLWLTQRLCRLDYNKPLLMRWADLYEMFGGESVMKEFKRKFPQDLQAALTAYPDARVEAQADGYLFKASPPPVPKLSVMMPKSIP